MSATNTDSRPSDSSTSFQSFWAPYVHFTDVQQNSAQWNKEWENVLKTLTDPVAVYNHILPVWHRVQQDAPHVNDRLRAHIVHDQRVLTNIVAAIFDVGHVDTIWILLEDDTRRNHILNALEHVVTHSVVGQDARPLCPEITSTRLLKGSGQPFIDLLRHFYRPAAQDTSSDAPPPFFFQSPWWDRAIDAYPKPLSDSDRSTYDSLTLARNEFITSFVATILHSITRDIVQGDKSMTPVMTMMSINPSLAKIWAGGLKFLHEKTLIRCQKCERSPEDLGLDPDTKFMVCSVCRTKLDCTVRYCSQECQKSHWPQHKKVCGKTKTDPPKGLIEDNLHSSANNPDFFRDIPVNPDGRVSITNIGAGAPQYARSRALRRQVALIEAHKDVDYFLFNSRDIPLPVVLPEGWLRTMFRILRKDAMSRANRKGVEAIAEYLIKLMADRPGLSRDIILNQLCREYGDDLRHTLPAFEGRSPEGVTFIETMNEGLDILGPRFMPQRGR